MIRYRLKKDLKSIGKAGTVVAWSLQNQLEYAHLFGLLDKWPEIFNDYFEEIKEEPKEVFTWDDENVSKIVADAHRDGFHKEPLGIYDRIQNFKQSKPDTSKERIEVVFYEDKTKQVYPNSYFAATSKPIPSNKFIEINKAIESVLNNDVNFNIDLSAIENISIGSRSLTPKELIALMFKEGAIELVRKYTQSDMDKAREQTWKACRETTDQPIGRGEYNDGDCGDLYRNKYPTLESYLQTIKK